MLFYMRASKISSFLHTTWVWKSYVNDSLLTPMVVFGISAVQFAVSFE